jgi:predicted nucleic acid-binding protein
MNALGIHAQGLCNVGPAEHNEGMTRYAIDAPAAIRLVREGVALADQHTLVAPNLLRSQVLSQLYRAVRGGELSKEDARAILDGITTIRLLGDRVSRAAAWRIAEELGWDDITNAEYVAVAQLQADAFVTLDEQLAREVEGIVATAPFEALLRA